MTNLIKPSILAFALVLQTCNYVPGTTGTSSQPTTPHKPNPTQASEVDPGLAIGGLSLLAGALTLLRMRRTR